MDRSSSTGRSRWTRPSGGRGLPGERHAAGRVRLRQPRALAREGIRRQRGRQDGNHELDPRRLVRRYTPEIVGLVWVATTTTRRSACTRDSAARRSGRVHEASGYATGAGVSRVRGTSSRRDRLGNGLLASPGCPVTRYEAFVSGTEPTEGVLRARRGRRRRMVDLLRSAARDDLRLALALAACGHGRRAGRAARRQSRDALPSASASDRATTEETSALRRSPTIARSPSDPGAGTPSRESSLRVVEEGKGYLIAGSRGSRDALRHGDSHRRTNGFDYYWLGRARLAGGDDPGPSACSRRPSPSSDPTRNGATGRAPSSIAALYLPDLRSCGWCFAPGIRYTSRLRPLRGGAANRLGTGARAHGARQIATAACATRRSSRR